MLFIDVKKGFSLLELILVLGVGTMVAFMKFQDMKNEQEQILATAVGQQMKQIGEAVNGYINIRYEKLATQVNAAGNGTDPGPRTCSSTVCEITYQTLVNEGLLPSTFNGMNAFRSPYKIQFRRSGIAPNYIINGVITTSSSWIESGAIRYDLLGKAMFAAGVDSGVTKTASTANGYNGQWTETSANFNNITTAGQFAYRVGYNSALYSMYLRRDGTLPMTGNLNMGANDIYNAKDITASGKGDFGGNITSGGTVTAAGEVIAHNGYGDTISLGGDAAGTDYEIRLAQAKPLSIFSPSVPTNDRPTTTVFQTNGRMVVIGDHRVTNLLGTNGLDPRDLPPGWGGGVRAFDILASGTIAVVPYGKTGTSMTNGATDAASYMDRYGNIYASNDIMASGNIKSLQTVSGRFVKPTEVVVGGQTCSENGLLARDNAGQVLNCVSGYWQSEMPVGSPIPWPTTTPPTGWLVCNGQAFNKSQYPLLAKAYPSGVLPDLRGQFIRGLDQGRGQDSEPNRAILSQQTDTLQNHNHSLPTSTGYVAGSNQGDSSMQAIFLDAKDDVMATRLIDPGNVLKNGNNSTPTTGDVLRTYDLNWSISTPYSTAPRHSAETRTKNVAFIYIVRAM